MFVIGSHDVVSVINKYHCKALPANAVVIMRGTKYGNLARVGVDVPDNETAVEMYRRQLWGQIRTGYITIQELVDLDDKVLVCCCKPKPCHGDVLVEAIRWAKTVHANNR